MEPAASAMGDPDPIAAIATGAGVGRRAAVRISGFGAVEAIAEKVGGDARRLVDPPCRGIVPGTWALDGGGELPAILLVAPGPDSFTGEDVIEIQVPGARHLAERVVDEACATLRRRLGRARAAGPGEFSARAFLNGRLSVAEATAIAAAVAADRDDELDEVDSIRRSRPGRRLQEQARRLEEVMARLEASIDFTDEEDVVGATTEELLQPLGDVRAELLSMLEAAEAFGEARTGDPVVVLAGPPNAGKSSLFNAMLGFERVVSSPVAGTTRDAIEADLDLDGDDGTIRIRLVDTAGTGGPPADQGGLEGLAAEATLTAVRRADLVLECRASDDSTEVGVGDLLVLTKQDLADPGSTRPLESNEVATSARTGLGLADLRRRITAILADRRVAAAPIVGWTGLVREAVERVDDAIAEFDAGRPERPPANPETAAAACRAAAEGISRVTGTFDHESVLDLVFGRFCIGK